MPDSGDFDWIAAHTALEEVAPKVLRTFPLKIRNDQGDIIQEVLLKLQRSQLDEVPSTKLLSVMVRHSAIDRIRASRRLSPIDEELVSPLDSTVQNDRQELWQLLNDALDRLNREEYVLLMKFYRGNVPIQNLATDAGVSYSAMAVRLFRIKEKLRAELSKRE